MFPAVFNLNSLTGSNGFSVNAASNSVAGIGDVNKDGVADIGIAYPGGAYVIYGSEQIWPQAFDVSTLNGNNGFSIYNLEGALISSAGDMNVDGIDDFMVCDNLQSNLFVVFGSSNNFPNPFNILTITGNNGFIIKGITCNSISSTNNLRGDGKDAILIAGYEETSEDQTNVGCVIFSSAESWPGVFDLTTLNGYNGFGFIFDNLPSGLCTPGSGISSVSGVMGIGDVNDDGYNDIGITIPGWCGIGPVEALFFSWLSIIYGSPIFNTTIYSSSLNFSTLIASSDSRQSKANAISVSGGKDLNGDGISDFAVSLPGYGVVSVYFGSSNINPNNVQTISVTGNYYFGGSIAVVDDISGDKRPDLVIGATSSSTDEEDQSYIAVMLGHNISDPFPSTISVADFNGINGFVINEGKGDYNLLGSQVSSAGDVNKDGINDVIIAAPPGEDTKETGMAYVVFGSDPNQPSPTPHSTHDKLSGIEIGGVIAGAVVGVVLLSAGIAWYGKTHSWWCAGDHTHGDGYVGVDGGVN